MTTEHGFYHPDHGYWQTTGDVPQGILDTYPSGTIEVEIKPGEHYEFIDGEWTYVAPPLNDPLAQPLDRLTFWLAAAEVGVSKWSVRDKIALMPPGVERDAAIAWFEEARQYRRNDPLLIQLAAAEGITEPQLDALWVWALGNPS